MLRGPLMRSQEAFAASGITPVIIRREGIGEHGGQIVTDYRPTADAAEDHEDSAPFGTARVISRLPELLDIVF